MALIDTPQRRLLVLAMFVLTSTVAFAQDDSQAEDSEATETEAAEPVETAEDEEDDLLDLEDPDLDLQGFDPNADDDFIPTEQIPSDVPIDFPTDI